AVMREHEDLLREWMRSAVSLQRGSLLLEGLQMSIGFALAGWIIFSASASGIAGATLLLVYWVLNLPALGYELSLHAREYPAQRSALMRLLEPLGAAEHQPRAASTPAVGTATEVSAA